MKTLVEGSEEGRRKRARRRGRGRQRRTGTAERRDRCQEECRVQTDGEVGARTWPESESNARPRGRAKCECTRMRRGAWKKTRGGRRREKKVQSDDGKVQCGLVERGGSDGRAQSGRGGAASGGRKEKEATTGEQRWREGRAGLAKGAWRRGAAVSSRRLPPPQTRLAVSRALCVRGRRTKRAPGAPGREGLGTSGACALPARTPGAAGTRVGERARR